MLVARRMPVPVGLVRFSDRPESYSVVVKLTYDISKPGWAKLIDEQDALSADAFDDWEARTYPTDFAALKLTCDVLIVGAAVEDDEAGTARVRAATLTKTAACAALLGPLPADPTDPLAQAAPADQRLPWPTLPLEVAVDHAGEHLESILPAPAPSAALVYDGQFTEAIALPLHIDGILVDPIERVCHVTFRGCFHHVGSVHRNVLLVVAYRSLNSVEIEEVEAWPRVPVDMDPTALADSFVIGADEVLIDVDDAEDAPGNEEIEPAPSSVTDVKPLPTKVSEPPPPAPLQRQPTEPFLKAPVIEREAATSREDDAIEPSTPSRRPLMVIGTLGTPLGYAQPPLQPMPTERELPAVDSAEGSRAGAADAPQSTGVRSKGRGVDRAKSRQS